MYYINYFFTFSILGFIIEKNLSIIFNYNFNSGILYGPYSIVYGIGIIIVIIIYNYLNNKINKSFYKFFLLFIINCFILTILEIIGGFLIELLFHKIYWSYKNDIIIFKYSSLKMMIIWGISSIIFIKFIYKTSNKLINKIPKIITELLIIIFIFDLILTIILKSYLFK